MRIYQAGGLFTAAEIEFNRGFCARLREAGHDVFLPQEIEQQLTPGYGRRIFLGDVAGLDWAEAVVAILEGADVDSGTSWECGYAYGKGKPVFGYRSDFRILGPEEKCNLMIEQACVSGLYSDMTALLAALRS